ncbi:T9SS type A sorting domain-containing protein [Polaribacter sp. Q13]|uniref:T9SS type A sorting domain-containing protein n=1 Tax=Polaribacter sp. Q13 TaxID=2806551 RepID=UPI00193B2ABB|nr:T9SS type A sorting domain-containing protein [Polaribacter sp. Q13]QVY66645.1 T9SS type A sorting domain-containing protein [Polaribacter sp. Q13]
MKYIIKNLLLISTFIVATNLNAQTNKADGFGVGEGVRFNKSQLSKSNITNALIDYLPETGSNHTETAFVFKPKGLSKNLNIKETFSVSYYQGKNKVSSVIATKSDGVVYDHSKIIYDRLNNDRLDSISTILVNEHQVIKSKISSVSGQTKYTLRFSIRVDTKENELFSFWNIDQYPTGNYHNYIIFGTSFSQVLSIANFIIDKHSSKDGLKSTLETSVLPNVFVKSGSYVNGILNLNIVNRTQEKSVNFVGNIAETELTAHIKAANVFSLSGNYNEVLSIETGVLFDIGFYLETTSSKQKDALYVADGPWGLDYLKEYVTVSNFEVNLSEREEDDAIYEVDRSVKVIGEVKGNINLFRHLLPRNESLSVEGYNFINFNIKNNEPVEVVIMTNENRDWEHRLRYTIPANSAEKTYTISLLDFVDDAGKKVMVSSIKTIVFSVIGDYTYYKPFSLDINKIAFTLNNNLNEESFTEELSEKLLNYPNPFTNSTTIQLPKVAKYIQINVYNLMGRIVDAQKINTNSSSSKKVQYNAPQLKKGVYKYRLIDDENNQHSGTFIVN